MSYNSDIDISCYKNIDEKIYNEIQKEFYSNFSHLPKDFSWSKISKNDNEEMIKKKNLISVVKNQYLCGCCWAISCTTAMSDAFVIKGLVDWAPNISYTYALSRYPQQKCSGGSSRVLLENIKIAEGMASDYCVDESWCLYNSNCVTSDSSKHFTAKNQEYLSTLIPSAGCYDGNKKHYVYEINDVYSITKTKFFSVPQIQDIIKKHIIVRGPVVSGFLIKKNFPSGAFCKIKDGIYFEDVNYENIDNYNEIIGSHSVVIVGWGEKNNIPYWYCRNSWGHKWGEDGHFKIAMYPHNKECQFSKTIKVLNRKKIKEVGGVTGFNVTDKPLLKKIKSNNARTQKLKNNKQLYFMDENFIFNLSENNASIFQDKNNQLKYYIVLLFVLIFIFKIRTTL